MLRKIIIKFALKQLVILIESDKCYGDCTDLGINEIKTNLDEHLISINKSNKNGNGEMEQRGNIR